MVLTQFLHRFDCVFADPVAAAVVDVLAPLEVLALHAVPESRETQTRIDFVVGAHGLCFRGFKGSLTFENISKFVEFAC